MAVHLACLRLVSGRSYSLTRCQVNLQCNLTYDCNAAADGLFNRIRPPMWTHWRHLANTIERVLPLAHPNPQPTRQIDWFSRFSTAHGRKSLYFTMGRPFPLKTVPPHWESGLQSNTQLRGPPESATQTAPRSVQPFCGAHSCDRPTDRPTDHATRSVTIAAYAVLRCGLTILRTGAGNGPGFDRIPAGTAADMKLPW